MSNKVLAQRWIEENNIHSVRVETISLDGVVSGKYLSTAKFISGADKGWSFCDIVFGVDLANAPQLGFDFGDWRSELGDIILKGDFATLSRDPQTPGLGSIICDLVDRKNAPLPVCSRSTLRRMVSELDVAGYSAMAAVEIEATVFEESIDVARSRGFKDLKPLGGGAGALYVLARPLEFTQYLDAVSRRLEEVGIPWEGWCDESGAGQVEVVLPPSDPLTAADRYNRVKFIMRQVAYEHGRTVTFMAKWSATEYGQGSHINLSLQRNGSNAFFDPDDPHKPTADMLHFIGGALDTMAAASSFSFPTINSYRRIQELNGPPTTISWGMENKSTAIRAIGRDANQARLEYRIPSADANIYLAFAAFLAGGLIGLEGRIDPAPGLDVMAWALPGNDVARLPSSLFEATDALVADTSLRQKLGEDLVDYWIGTRRWEWLQFHLTGGDPEMPISDWELARYFELV